MRKSSLLLVLLLCIPTLAPADRARMKNGSYPERARAWSKFAILGVKLGGELEKVPGFTCGPPPGTDGFSTQNHSCVKFLDARCKGKPTRIHNIRSTADVDKGQSCFMEEFTGATYLDRKFTTTPLSAVRIVGTNTSAPLVFQITYTFAADDLTDDSNLGKALIAKYGPPSSRNPPISMSWNLGQVQLLADCRSTEGPTGEFCRITVVDDELDATERSIQQQADEDARKTHGPPAPKL